MSEHIHPESGEQMATADRRASRRQPLPALAVIAVAICLGVVAFFAVREATKGSSSKPTARAPAARVSAPGLKSLAGALSSPIYWVGAKTGYTLEFTKTSGNQIFIRYLPAGVPVGSPQTFLTIATYPVASAFTVTQRAAAASGTVKIAVGGGGVAFYGSSSLEHVYLAYPGTSSQIEVYDPSPGQAAQIVSSGQVRPVVVKHA